jgi:hypothetical protein
MAFNGTEGGSISLSVASDWTKNYRDTISDGEVKAHFFGKDIISDILNQDHCMGIRIYYAIDDNGAKQLILVGVDGNEKDQTEGIVADFSVPCPHSCDVMSDLNS